MRKQKLKNYLKFGILLFGISLIITNCQKDDLLNNAEIVEIPNSIFKMRKINQLEIEKNSNVLSKIDKIKNVVKSKNGNTSNKTVYSSENNFYIETDEATYIETQDNSYHSYTFSIFRDIDNGLLENLILSLQEDGTYKSYIITYDLTPQEIEDLNNGLYLDTSNRFEMIEIDSSNLTSNIFNKIIYVDCVVGSQTFWECDNGVAGHMPGNPGPPSCVAGGFSLVIQTQWGTCAVDDGNYDDSGFGGGGSTGGGGGGSGNPSDPNNPNYDPSDPNIHGNGSNNLPVLTSPNTSLPQDTNPKKLKILTQHPQIKAKITELKGKTSENREYGYQFNISGNNPITYNPIEGELASDNQGIKFPPASVFTQLEMHTHFDGLDNAFTASDIYKATKLAITSPNAPAILVAPNGKLYALMVTDQAKAQAFLNYNNQEGEEGMNRYYNLGVIKVANNKCGGTCTDQEYDTYLNQALVQYLGSTQWDSGLTLYEATEDSAGNITWTPVTITP